MSSTMYLSRRRPAKRWVRRHAIPLALVLIATLLAALPASAGHGDASLAGSNFEIDDDANLKVDHPNPSLDWANVDENRKDDEPTGQNDDSYKGGAKEDDPCPTTTTGSIPNNKSDLLTFGNYVEEGDGSHPGFLHLFWTRVQEPNGTTLMDFELNQSTTPCNNGVNPVRTVDDLLIEYQIDQGGARATILAREWNGSAWGPEQDLTAIGAATGTINDSPIPAAESDGLGSLSARTFGELSLDLEFILPEGECAGFGSAFVKSRSSTSFTSQLKDFIKPVEVDLDTCGPLTIVKEDSQGNRLGGADFSVYLDDGDGTEAADGTDSGFEPEGDDSTTEEDELVGTCTTAAADDSSTPDFNEEGTCVFDGTNGEGLAFGNYWVEETDAPDGYDLPDDTVRLVTINSVSGATITFVNAAQPGQITILKVDDADDPTTPGDESNPIASVVFELYAWDDVDEDTDLTFTDGNSDGLFDKDDDTTVELEDADGTDSGLTPLDTCTTDSSGVCQGGDTTDVAFDNVDPGFYCVVEDLDTVPSSYTAASPNWACFEVEITAGGDQIDLEFVNPRRLHEVIVIVCHEDTNTLAASDVTNGTDTLTTLAEGATLPDGVSEEELCGLAGFGGKEHGNKSLTVDVGSDAH